LRDIDGVVAFELAAGGTTLSKRMMALRLASSIDWPAAATPRQRSKVRSVTERRWGWGRR
jgi:hypothetical protein